METIIKQPGAGIVKDLCFGYLQDAKRLGKHATAHFSDLVIEELATNGKDAFGRDFDVYADVQRHVDATMKAFGCDGNANTVRAAVVKEFAIDSYGMVKELEARGINPRRDSGAKFFNVTANTPLFPQFLANRLVEGRLSAGLVDVLTYADVPIDRLTYDKVRLTSSDDSLTMRNVGFGGNLPLSELSQVGTNVPLRKYGRTFMYVREVVENSPLAIVEAHLRKMGQLLAISETDEVIEILHAGDGESGSAVTDTTPAVDGTLAYADLITLELAFSNSYVGRIGLATATNFQTILGMAEYKDPVANRGVRMERAIPSVPSPSGMAQIYRWSSTGSTYMAEAGGRVVLVDNSEACYTVRQGDILEEFDTHIRSGKNEVALSYKMAVVKGDPSCTKSLDVTA